MRPEELYDALGASAFVWRVFGGLGLRVGLDVMRAGLAAE
jgi:hypothetical protein